MGLKFFAAEIEGSIHPTDSRRCLLPPSPSAIYFSNANHWSFTHQNLKKKNPKISSGFQGKQNKTHSMVAEKWDHSEVCVPRDLFVKQQQNHTHTQNQHHHQTHTRKENQKPSFDAIQKLEVVSTPSVYFLVSNHRARKPASEDLRAGGIWT